MEHRHEENLRFKMKVGRREEKGRRGQRVEGWACNKEGKLATSRRFLNFVVEK